MPLNDVKCVLLHDNFQNFKSYNGGDFYASRPDWYVDGDNKNGESGKARKAAFHTDYAFNIAEFMHFASRMLKKEPAKGDQL